MLAGPIVYQATKGILIFIAGVVFALIIVQALSGQAKLPSSESIQGISEGKVKEEIQEKERSVITKVVERVLPAVTENPVIAPVFETKKEVEETVEAVKALPQDQINAICRQYCSP